ncbi:MAG TPA: DNA methyltransferase [Methanoculleus sp.]|jgi:hypothetical protein|nr:DNA methyltransferase [Methanoculleus sp.]
MIAARAVLEARYRDRVRADPALTRRLVSFQANKSLPFYRLFKYKEGFSADLVRRFLQDAPPGGTVLDPFAGAGTTLFAAQAAGFHATGIEVLPVGAFAIKARSALGRVDPDDLAAAVARLRADPLTDAPAGPGFRHLPITRGAFSPATEAALNAYLAAVAAEPDDDIATVLRFAAFAVLEEISYTRKDGQFLRWDRRSGRARATFDKGPVLSFSDAVFGHLGRIQRDLVAAPRPAGPPIDLREGSCLAVLPTLPASSFDRVITSPPYCNRYDYTRTYALELAFLGVDAEGLKALRQTMLACTVENRAKRAAIRDLCAAAGQPALFDRADRAFQDCEALQEVLAALEGARCRGDLNNPGVCRMVAEYCFEHAVVVFALARLLKPGGRVYYVNDNVRYAGELIPVDLILAEFAEAAGLEVPAILTLPHGKGNSSQQMGRHGREEVRKCVSVWEAAV